MWYVVAQWPDMTDPEDTVWTVSRDPNVPGWNTDGGYPGYGLTKADAEELAQAANTVQRREVTTVVKGYNEKEELEKRGMFLSDYR